VWPRQGRLILLVGYPQYRYLKRFPGPCGVIEKQLESREEARRFIIQDQLARRNLTPLAVSYLRGLTYAELKQTRGGDRRSQQAVGRVSGKTAAALAE